MTNPNFRQELSQFGDSLLVISDDEVAKVHIHSEEPGDVLTLRSKISVLLSILKSKICVNNILKSSEKIIRYKTQQKRN